MKKHALLLGAALGLGVLFSAGSGMAQAAGDSAPAATPPAQTAEPASAATPAPDAAESEKRYEEFLQHVAKLGPKQIPLHGQAALDLPEGYAFLADKVARKVMETMGNQVDEGLIGLIMPAKDDGWYISVEYIPSGYIKDDDAKSWDADKLLDDIRRNTEESNKQRSEHGATALEIVGWAERPHYDAATHRLIWCIAARDKGAPSDADNLVNYRTLMLGREGYISMTLVTDSGKLPAQKPIANLMLAKLNFDTGKTYADFNASTDHIAEYGLAALVAGVAAKKLGLLALAIAFIAKFAKIGIVAALGLFAVLRRKFGLGGKAAPQTIAQIEAPPEVPPPPAAQADAPPSDKLP